MPILIDLIDTYYTYDKKCVLNTTPLCTHLNADNVVDKE